MVMTMLPLQRLRLGEGRSSELQLPKAPPRLSPHFHSLSPLTASVSSLIVSLLSSSISSFAGRSPLTDTFPAMDQHDDFDNVSWRHDPDSDVSRPTTSGTDVEEAHRIDHDANGKRRMSSAHEEPQAGSLADAVDLAGIGDGVLECQVDSPLKENDGTKDAYISYLVRTNVRPSFDLSREPRCHGLLLPAHSRVLVIDEDKDPANNTPS